MLSINTRNSAERVSVHCASVDLGIKRKLRGVVERRSVDSIAVNRFALPLGKRMHEKQVRSESPSNRSTTQNTEHKSSESSRLARLPRDKRWRQQLQDEGITMAELVELVYKLVGHENLPFFPGSDGRLRPWKIPSRILDSNRRPATIEGGRAANRDASRIRAISGGAGRKHR
jgi:hypothetical protein